MSEPRWLDAREARAWRGFLRMQMEVLARSARQLQQEAGLSAADYEVLVSLSEADDNRMRVFELGQATKWEKSRLSHHLTRMEQRGLVARERCPSDNRGAFVVLTDSGRAAIEAAAPLHVEHVRKIFVDALTPEQLEALGEISEAVLAGFDDDGCESECVEDDG